MTYSFTPRDADVVEIMKLSHRLRAETAAALLVAFGRVVTDWTDRARQAVVGLFRSRQQTQVEQAVAELRAYNDNELSDLGIGRDQIVDAVLHGRPGIERPAA